MIESKRILRHMNQPNETMSSSTMSRRGTQDKSAAENNYATIAVINVVSRIAHFSFGHFQKYYFTICVFLLNLTRFKFRNNAKIF